MLMVGYLLLLLIRLLLDSKTLGPFAAECYNFLCIAVFWFFMLCLKSSNKNKFFCSVLIDTVKQASL